MGIKHGGETYMNKETLKKKHEKDTKMIEHLECKKVLGTDKITDEMLKYEEAVNYK